MTISGRFRVELTAVAAGQANDIKRRAWHDGSGFHGLVWRWLYTNLIRDPSTGGHPVLARPEGLLGPNRALGARKFDFTGLYREKFKGATRGARIVYGVSIEEQVTLVLLLGERIPGSEEDVYETLAAHLLDGSFDASLAKFRIDKPPVLPTPTQ